MSYVITVNRAGYLPEQEPYEVDSFDEACEAIRTEITQTVDAHDGPGAEEYGAQEAEAHQETLAFREGMANFVKVGEYVHAITPKGNLHPTPDGWRR